MSKVNAEIKINNHKIKNIGILNNEILKIKTKEELITFDYKNLILKKDNKDLKIALDFKNKEVFYELKEENIQFHNNFIILSLTNDNKQVIINYQIEQTNFLLSINIETII